MLSGNTKLTTGILSLVLIALAATTATMAADAAVTCMLWAAASLVWLVLLWVLHRTSAPLSPATIGMMAAVPLITAALNLPVDSVYSDDATRYRWDGLVVSHGMSPYAAAPSDSSWTDVPWMTPDHDTLRRRVSHASLPTIYPPGAQILFGVATVVGGTSPAGWKSVWLVVVAVLTVTAWCLLGSATERRNFLMALCSPIVLFHGIIDVHVDLPMALLLLLAILLLRRRNVWLAGQAMAMAIAIKYLPVLALPFLVPMVPAGSRWKVATALVAALAVVYGPFVGGDVLGSLGTYTASWQANSLAWSVLAGMDIAPSVVRPVLAASMALAGLVVWRMLPTVRGVGLAFIAVMLFSPVVHPWYLLAPVILLPMATWRATIVWGASMASYGVALIAYKGDGLWVESPVALVVQFVPVAGALVMDLLRPPIVSARDA